MSHLKNYVDQRNRVSALFGEDEKINIANINQHDANRLFDLIECDLSPENLCCDGELSFAAVQRKATVLNGARAELAAMGFEHTEEL